MKKTYLFFLLIFVCILFVGCQSKEDKAIKLALEANLLIESDDLELALLKYIEVNTIFPSEEYSSTIQYLNTEIIFKQVNKLVDDSKFTDAILLLVEHEKQENFSEKINEIYYLWEKFSLSNKDYTNSIKAFETSIDYMDSQELLEESKYQKALTLIRAYPKTESGAKPA